ncbi:MAG: hypothetical protein II695_12680, partial [Oscillospiraceae bacterium]|nr:hypothetical protein [Oscillospiraceae bacterium]
ATETTAPSSETDSTSDTEDTSVSETAQTISETEAASESETTSENTETSSDETLADTSDAEAGTAASANFAYKSADIDISLVIDRGRYIIDNTEIPRNEVAFSVCGINTDDASAGTDDKIVRAYSMAFTRGTDRVEAVSDNVLVKYVFTEKVPESAAASIEVYTMSNGTKTRVETLGTSIEDGYVKGLTFKASLPAFDSFCVVWEDTAPKPDESIISADRSYEYSDDTMTARATAFAGAVCTGNADDTAVPENANNISFAVDTADEDDEVCSLFDSNEAENRTVFVQRFYSESYESVDVSDYETAVTYALSVPVPESYGFAVKVRAADEDGISDIEYMPICEDGSITALTFYVKGAFAVYEPVRGEQFSIDYSDDNITASAVIGENAVITAGERAATSDSLYISANILDEDEAASLPVYEETEKKLIYIRAAVMSGEEKADISDSRVSMIYNVGSEEKLSCASAVLMRLDGDQWTQMDIASSSAADDVLQSLSFDASGAEYFVIAADIIPEPPVPHFYEYSDENLSVNVEVDAEAVFSAGGEAEEDEDSETEEIDAAEVRLYAKEIDAAEDIDIEVGEDERVKFFDIGFETKDGTAVSADLLTLQIDFTIKGEEGESISNIEVFALSDSQTEQIDAAGTEDAADDEDAAQSDASVGVVSVEDNKLTVYAVKYTVDFHYGDYEYNLEGGGDMLLSELFDALGIEESTKGSTIEFTNDALLRYEMVEDADEPDTAADWRLISLRPFTTVEKLTVRLADGGNVEITVTDDISRYLAVGSSYYFRDVLDWIGIEGSHDDRILKMGMPGFDGVATSKYEVVPVDDHNTLRDYLITIKEPLDTSASLTVGGSPLYVKEVSPGVFEETTAADGVQVKYEFVHPKSSVSDESVFFRLTRGTNTEVGGVQTWHADTAAEDHYFEYELYYVVSGDDKIGVGEMNIVLPLHILRDSQGNYADDIELSIPDKELYDSQQHSSLATDKIYFTYTIDEANNVVRITNVKELSSGDNPTIVYAYKTTKKTYDYNDGVPSEPAFANIRINTTSASDSTKPVIVSGHTEQIPVAIDTDVDIKKTEKTIAQSSISQLWKEEWNNSLSLDPNDYHIEDGEIVYDYVYMVWKVNSSFVSYDIGGNEIHAGNNSITKRYSFSLTGDQISAINEKGVAINGEIIGVNLAGRNEWVAWDGTSHTTEIDRLVGKDRTDYVLVRYPKSAVNLYDEDAATGKKTPVKVTFKNDVENQIIPQGDTNEITGNAHGEIIYTPPTYKPPEENTEFDKHGKYGGNIDVKSDKDISFYNLETLVNKNQPIKGLKYNTKMFSSMLPLTFDPAELLSQTEEDVEHYQWADAVYILKDETLSLTDLNQSKNNADYKAYKLIDDDY